MQLTFLSIYRPPNRPFLFFFALTLFLLVQSLSPHSRSIHMTDDTIHSNKVCSLFPSLFPSFFPFPPCTLSPISFFLSFLRVHLSLGRRGRKKGREGRIDSKSSHPDIIGSGPCPPIRNPWTAPKAKGEQKVSIHLCKLSFDKEDQIGTVLMQKKSTQIIAIFIPNHIPSRASRCIHIKNAITLLSPLADILLPHVYYYPHLLPSLFSLSYEKSSAQHFF